MNHVENNSSDNNFSQVTETPIKRKKARGKQIRVLMLTGNEHKKKEYANFLEKTYGVRLFYRGPPEVISDQVARKILSEMKPTPHYILREESRLKDDITKKVLSGLEVVKNPEMFSNNFLYNSAHLQVWIPKWNKNSTLKEIERKEYFHKVRGYIDSTRKDELNEAVFGWDPIFVNAITGRTNLDADSLWGKSSARQLVLADFVTNHLFYKKPHTLKHHDNLNPKQGVEFSMEMSVGRFMEENKYLSNQNLSIWGLDAIKERILNEGVFFKAGTSRPVRNYFSPPFGGIPLTAKKTDVEETIFMMHDLNHHNIPDLIFDGDDSVKMQNVYVAWRMMSEAMTLVIADMLYADTLVRTDPENEQSVDRRIYPLFKALDIEAQTEKKRQDIIRKLLWANTQYAVLGDDSEWKKMVKQGQEGKLKAYKDHFGKFFIGDHVWTNKNFKNMASKKESYNEWIKTVGKDQFEKAGLLFLSDVVEKIKSRDADLSSFKDVVTHVFDEILETRIFPTETSDSVKVDEEERLSRGFRRYMIGQMSFYFRFQELEGISGRAQALAEKIKENEFFDKKLRDEIYNQYKQDVFYVWGMGVITTSAAHNYTQVHPIFPPFYITYSEQEKIYGSIENVVTTLYGEKND